MCVEMTLSIAVQLVSGHANIRDFPHMDPINT
jgi:hypothetical protein